MDYNPSVLAPEPITHRRIMRLLPGDEKRISLANRGVFFLEEIDDSSSYMMTMNLLYDHVNGSDIPIWTFLNSPGGEVDHGFAIFDIFEAAARKGRQINIVGIGKVASMATAIMQAGTRRYSFPNTQFLIHQVRQVLPFFKAEEVNEGRERQAEMDRINDIVMKIIADRSGMELDEIKKLSEKKDHWLDAKGAKSFGKNGLIDEIITGLPF